MHSIVQMCVLELQILRRPITAQSIRKHALFVIASLRQSIQSKKPVHLNVVGNKLLYPYEDIIFAHIAAKNIMVRTLSGRIIAALNALVMQGLEQSKNRQRARINTEKK